MPRRSYTGNPPTAQHRLRVIVKPRPTLPKAFFWEIVDDDGWGNIKTVKRAPSVTAFSTMEAAYNDGQAVLKQHKDQVSSSVSPKPSSDLR